MWSYSTAKLLKAFCFIIATFSVYSRYWHFGDQQSRYYIKSVTVPKYLEQVLAPTCSNISHLNSTVLH